MRISVRVKPNSKENRVEGTGPNEFLVMVKAPPKEGKANQELIECLAKHFGVAKGRICIVSGLKSKHKILNIEL